MTSQPESTIRQLFRIENGILVARGECPTSSATELKDLGFGESQCVLI